MIEKKTAIGYLVGIRSMYYGLGDGEQNTDEFPDYFLFSREEAEVRRAEVQSRYTRDGGYSFSHVAYLAPVFSDGSIGEREYLPIRKKGGEV